MSFLFELDENHLSEQLPAIFERFERDAKTADLLFNIEGERLELVARNVPMHQAHYSMKAQEAKHLVKWLENYKAKQEAIVLKNYNRGQRALSATDQRILLAGEKDIVETNQLIIEASLLANQLADIVEGFKQMGWMVGNITKVRVAELQDIII